MDNQEMQNPEPQKSGGCLKTCLIGCGTVFLVMFLIIAAITIWFLLPYDTYKFEDFFCDNHVGAVEVTLNPSNEGIFTMIKNAMVKATKELNKDKSEAEQIQSLAQLNSNAEKIKSISSISCQFLVSSNGSKEAVLVMAPMPGSISKLMQSLFSMTMMVMPSEISTSAGGASVLLFKDSKTTTATPVEEDYGMTCIKGYGMIGQVEPLIKQAALVVSTGKPAEARGDGYLVSNWPKNSKSILKVVLDNKQRSVDRLIKYIVVEIEVLARTKALESQGQTPVAADIRNEVLKNYQPTSLDSNFFKGVTIEADLVSLNDIKLPLKLELRDPAGMNGLKGWIQQVAQRVSSLTMLTINVGNMTEEGDSLLVPLQIQGMEALMEKLAEAEKLAEQQRQLEGKVGTSNGIESDCTNPGSDCGAPVAAPPCATG